MTIPAEIRLDIYRHTFVNPTETTLRRREEIDDEELLERLSTSSIPSLLATCRQIHREALPIFYGSQNFYIGVPISMNPRRESPKDPSIYGSSLFHVRNHLELITRLSLGWDSKDLLSTGQGHVDQTLAAGIDFFAEKCLKLRAVTLNFFPNSYSPLLLSCRLRSGSATATALHTLHKRLDELKIVLLASHVTLRDLRHEVEVDEIVWERSKFKNGSWPCVSLMRKHRTPVVKIQNCYILTGRYIGPWKPCQPGVLGKDVLKLLERDEDNWPSW